MYKNIAQLIENISQFSGICDDSRKVKKGNIFVAVAGMGHDGHEYINEAIEYGASFVVGEKDSPLNNYLKVKDSREALGQLASAWFEDPSKKLKVIGVTGTKGKTTTSFIIYHILTKLGKKTGMVTSIEAKIGRNEIDTGFHVTSPDVIALQGLLKEMVDNECEYAVIEVSSHGIDQKRIAGVSFDIGVLTNIAPEHLDYHKTFGEYKKVKMSFVNSCKYKAISPDDTDLDMLPGKFNNLNIEAAIKAVNYLGITRDEALKVVESFRLPEGRLEEVENSKGIKIVIDFAHTPESLEAALKYLRTKTDKKMIAVFGCAGERDPYKRPKMGKVASLLSDVIILTAEDPRNEKVEDIIVQIRAGITDSKKQIYEIPDRKEAIKKALEIAVPGDSVGLFGKGHEKSMNLDGIHEIPWSDKEIVREYIR